MTDLIPAARPVPSPEDRMRDARTDRQYADRIPAPRPLTTDRTNGHHRDLHQHIAGLENDLRSQNRAVRELTAERDGASRELAQAWAALARADVVDPDPDVEVAEAIDRLADHRDAFLIDRDRLARELDSTRQTAAFRQGVIDRHRQELGAAGEVLAVVRDAAERIDRALAVYDTTPGEPALGSAPPRAQDDEATPRRLLDQAIESALPQAGGNVRPLLKALRRELKRVDAKRAEREG